MSQKAREPKPEPVNPDVLAERVIHGADEIALSLELAEPGKRARLVQAAAGKLEEQGVIMLDIHDAYKTIADFDPTTLPGVTGRTGRTRAQLLGELSIRSPRFTRRRR